MLELLIYLIVLFNELFYDFIATSLKIFALQNFLFVSKDDDAVMKVIDFGLSDFVRPGNMTKSTYYSQSQVVSKLLNFSYVVFLNLLLITVHRHGQIKLI